MSTIEKIIAGGTVESYRYEFALRRDPSRVSRKIEVTKEKMKKKKPMDYFKELVPSLVAARFLEQSSKKPTHKYGVRENDERFVFFFGYSSLNV